MTRARAHELRDRAASAAASGDLRGACALFDQAVDAAPHDAAILSSAASHWSKCGDPGRATQLFERAVAADPQAAEPLLNLAILLTATGHAGRAREILLGRERQLSNVARYWSVRAGAERACGSKREALDSYRRAARLDPGNARAVEGAARLALETGVDARDQYRAVLALAPGSPTAIMGFGQSLEVAGDIDGARAIALRLVEQLPGWTDGLEWLAQLRWGEGEGAEFADHYESAAERAGSAEVYRSWCKMLAGAERFGEAADVAARARLKFDGPHFALLEAVHAGEAGDDERAERIFASLQLQSIDRRVHEARHRLRTGAPDRAELLTAAAIDEAPEHVGAWALRDIAWRLTTDPRHEWLHGQPGLVGPMELDLGDEEMATCVAFLDRLHNGSRTPVGQSVRSGTQTRGGLFDRHEPEVRLIEDRFDRAVEAYRQSLPPADERHPLLRHRDGAWRFAGSWSIRVFSGGRHTEHVHPNGIVSSAAYFAVPSAADQDEPQAGWLELGRPPPDLRLDLPPLFAIEPLPGRCALFPSTLYHGTRRFSVGKRMTVAIDIHAA
jgi:tetratricopeptide (TPR) repeat protein